MLLTYSRSGEQKRKGDAPFPYRLQLVAPGAIFVEDLTKGASEQLNQAAEQAKDAASGAMEQAQGQVQEATSGAMEQAQSQAQDAASGAMEQAQDAVGDTIDKAKDILPGS
jgi:hypothetical protein